MWLNNSAANISIWVCILDVFYFFFFFMSQCKFKFCAQKKNCVFKWQPEKIEKSQMQIIKSRKHSSHTQLADFPETKSPHEKQNFSNSVRKKNFFFLILNEQVFIPAQAEQQNRIIIIMQPRNLDEHKPAPQLTLQSHASFRFSQRILTRAHVRCKVALVQIFHRQIHLPCERINHCFRNKILFSMI